MKGPDQDDEVQRLRERIRTGIDAAAKSVAEVLQLAADLFIATARHDAHAEPSADRMEPGPVHEMMTSEQAADYLGVKAQTLAVWRSTRRHSIPFVKVGRNVRYRKADLDEFLQCHTEHRGDDEAPE